MPTQHHPVNPYPVFDSADKLGSVCAARPFNAFDCISEENLFYKQLGFRWSLLLRLKIPQKVFSLCGKCCSQVGVMDVNQRQIALSILESLRADLMYAHLNNGGRVLDVADLRQYIYEQMGRIRTNALVLDGLYGADNGHGQDTKSNGNGKAHS
jgi:hypothetical protein